MDIEYWTISSEGYRIWNVDIGDRTRRSDVCRMSNDNRVAMDLHRLVRRRKRADLLRDDGEKVKVAMGKLCIEM